MNAQNILTDGTKVLDQYGTLMTVLEVIDNMVRVYEDFNNLYHISKLTIVK